MKFNSQICTSRLQSERLLALGLKKETADMFRPPSWGGDKIIGYYAPNAVLFNDHFAENHNDLPAWSLDRLIEMVPSFIDIGEHNYMFSIIQGKLFSYGSDIAGNAFCMVKVVYMSLLFIPSNG